MHGMRLTLWMLALATAAMPATTRAELLRRVSYEYDEQGRLIAERHVEPATGADVVVSRHAYDDEGRQISTTDALGRTTTVSYDALGRIATSRDPAGGVVALEYDAGDRIAQVADPRGLVTRYEWDGLGNLWKQVSPDTGTTTFAYSGEGLRTSMTRNDGNVTTFAYDGAGRLLHAKAGAEERVFGYDACSNGLGRLCTAELRAGGVVRNVAEHGYAPWGWLNQRRERGVDSTGTSYDHVTAYLHDGLGRITDIAYPSGIGVGYGYHAGKLTTMTATVDGATRTVATNIRQQPFGPVDGWTYGNGLERVYDFDHNGRLFGVSAGTGHTLVQSLTYGFNAADEIVAITHGLDGTQSRRFEYDAPGRLAHETTRGASWFFDANGNQIRWTGRGAQTDYVIEANSNRVASYTNAGGTRRYGYDVLGNRVSENATGLDATYAYDGFNRLRQATSNGAPSTYSVNALDQRIGKTTPGGTTRFTYADQNQLLAEQGTGGWTSYLWLGDELVGVVKPDKQLRFVHNDHLGRPEVVSNDAKQAVWRANNAEYGRTVTLDQIGGLNIGFPGQYFDAESGLWQNGYRDGYDDRIGRYTQPDPIGLAGGDYSLYAYSAGNPVGNVDPEGLQFLPYSRNLNKKSPHAIPEGVAQRLNVVWGMATTGATATVYAPIILGAGIMSPELAAGAANVCRSPQAQEAALRACIGLGVCYPGRDGRPDAWVGHRDLLHNVRDASNRNRLTENATWP